MSNLPDFDHLWDYNDPAKTEKAFRGLLPVAKSARNHDYHAQLLSQIARSHSLRRQFVEAHGILDDAETLIVNIDNPSNGPTQTARIRVLLERGRTFNSAGDTDSARPLFTEAWELARQAGEDYHAVDAAHMLGICEPADASLIWNNRAMEAAESSDDPRAKDWPAPCTTTPDGRTTIRWSTRRRLNSLRRDSPGDRNETTTRRRR